MRRSIPILLAIALAGCGALAPHGLQNSGTTSIGSNRIVDTLTGRGAGSPVACIGSGLSLNTASAGEGTLAFRRGGQTYVSSFEGSCSAANRPGYVLVTEDRGRGLCQGDIVRFVDTSTGMVAGSCVMGPFVPISALRRWQ